MTSKQYSNLHGKSNNWGKQITRREFSGGAGIRTISSSGQTAERLFFAALAKWRLICFRAKAWCALHWRVVNWNNIPSQAIYWSPGTTLQLSGGLRRPVAGGIFWPPSSRFPPLATQQALLSELLSADNKQPAIYNSSWERLFVQNLTFRDRSGINWEQQIRREKSIRNIWEEQIRFLLGIFDFLMWINGC